MQAATTHIANVFLSLFLFSSHSPASLSLSLFHFLSSSPRSSFVYARVHLALVAYVPD